MQLGIRPAERLLEIPGEVIMTKWLLLIILLIFGNYPLFCKMMELSNEYVKASVDYDSGRFLLETTGGNPENKFDKNIVLLYKKIPPTSITTISLNGQYYIFGSSSGSFRKKPYIDSNKILCEWTVKDITVVQEVSITKGMDTGLEDTMKISYNISNKSNNKVSVGLRILLDTVFGNSKPKAFFFPGRGKTDKETQFIRDDVPPYWYAFDNYENALFGVQGTLNEYGATKPDKVIFALLERLTANPWDLMIDSTKDFKRFGSNQYDGAVAIYFDPHDIDNVNSVNITTLYGQYGASFSPGKNILLSLDVPFEIKSPPIQLSSEAFNLGKMPIDKLQFEIFIPDGFSLTNTETNVFEFLKVDTNISKRVIWNLLCGSISGNFKVKVKASSWISNNVQAVDTEKAFSINYIDTNFIETNKPVTTENITNIEIPQSITQEVNTNTLSSIQVSDQEKKLLSEISELDNLIEDVNQQYQILMGIYMNAFTTNSSFLKELDTNINSYEEQLRIQELILSNQKSMERGQ